MDFLFSGLFEAAEHQRGLAHSQPGHAGDSRRPGHRLHSPGARGPEADGGAGDGRHPDPGGPHPLRAGV